MKRYLCLMLALPLLAQPPAQRPKPPNVKVGSTTEAARTIEFVPGVGTTYSLSCADGTCSLTINYTGGAPDVVDYTGASRTAPVKTGTSAPATCALGDWFFDTDAPAGRNIALCTAANTWTFLEAAFATLTGAQLTLPSIAAYTVANLPTPGTPGRLAVVTDAASAGSCASGGGANLALCRDNGSAWVALGDGGSGGGGGGGSGTSYVYLSAATCQYGVATTGFSLRTSDAPQPQCYEGTNTSLGVLRFPDSSATSVQTTIPIDGLVSSISLDGVWRTTATSGNVVWQMQTACAGDGETGDPAWGTAVAVTDAAKSTANQFNEFSFSSITPCESSKTMFVRFFRDPAHASDDLGAEAELIGLSWKIDRSVATSTYISLSAANCQYGAAATPFSVRAEDSPTTACYEGTNTNLGVLQFPDTSTAAVQTVIRPEGTVTAVDVLGFWRTTATSGSVVWQVQTACVDDGGLGDPTWGTAQTVVDAAKTTALQLNRFVLSGLTACQPGQAMFVRLFRDPQHASDNLDATAELVGVTWTIVR